MSDDAVQNESFAALMNDPQIRDALAYGIKKLAELGETRAQERARDNKHAAWMMALLIGAIVVPVTFLAYTGKISADSTTFIFGGLMGSGFAFVTKFFMAD